MNTAIQVRPPWNKGLIVGQKRPLLPRQVWSFRVRLEMSASARDLALFNLAIDTKLRASDLVRLKLDDICSGTLVRDRAVVTQLKTGRPVQFEITEVTRQAFLWRELTKDFSDCRQMGCRSGRLRGGCCCLYRSQDQLFCTTCVLRHEADQIERLLAHLRSQTG